MSITKGSGVYSLLMIPNTGHRLTWFQIRMQPVRALDNTVWCSSILLGFKSGCKAEGLLGTYVTSTGINHQDANQKAGPRVKHSHQGGQGGMMCSEQKNKQKSKAVVLFLLLSQYSRSNNSEDNLGKPMGIFPRGLWYEYYGSFN